MSFASEQIRGAYQLLLNSRSPIADAAAHLMQCGMSEGLVKAAVEMYEAKVQQISLLKDPPAMYDRSHKPWYIGPLDTDIFWPKYKAHLLSMSPAKWDPRDIDDLDTSSTKILSLLRHPYVKEFRVKGLVVGYVQSGKTANFTAVISKAADAGYKLFIVLSGLTNKLRNQTQKRLNKELRDLNPTDWHTLTDTDLDFDGGAKNPTAFLSAAGNQRVLCVVKKNSSRMNLLIQWLNKADAQARSKCATIIIDDEADQASINSAKYEGERTAINDCMVRLLQALPRNAYIGYTATPFANVFIDPADTADLYPRDFIVSLNMPASYFGTARIFGRERLRPDEPDDVCDGSDIIRGIPEADENNLKPSNSRERGDFAPKLDNIPSLKEAIYYFWMATAARKFRGQNEYSTMLIHTTQFAAIHNKFLAPLESIRKSALDGIDSGAIIKTLSDLWHTEMNTYSAPGLAAVSFDQLEPYLTDVIKKTEIIAENYLQTSDRRLNYEDKAPHTYIAVGGNILARGLTLEGLVTSYFIRSANAYDTLLQMGRWFGYRKGYEDLPRVWVTDELRDYFFDLATVEQEIRSDISRYIKEPTITPLNFAPRIRAHNQLLITARLKMKHAIRCSVSYSESRPQTILFNHKDAAWLDKNIDATKTLVTELKARYPYTESPAQWACKDVDVSEVFKFIDNYSFHKDSWNLDSTLLKRYIEQENLLGALKKWNVVIIGKKDSALGTIDIGTTINSLDRSRIDADTPHANLKAVISVSDAVSDLTMPAGQPVPSNWDEIFALRNEKLPDTGLLLLFPISKDSKAKPGSKSRTNLEAVNDIVGASFVFPKTKSHTDQTYMTADLSGVPQETTEIPEQEDSDE